MIKWKYFTPNTWTHVILTLTPSSPFDPPRSDRLWVRQVTFNQSLNRSYVSVRDSLVWIPNWPLDWEADGASNELGDQYAEATASKEEGGREGGVRGVIAPNQSLCSEAFGEMKQYSASTVWLLWFMFFVCWIQGCEKVAIVALVFIYL